jgi:hypothetical protein
MAPSLALPGHTIHKIFCSIAGMNVTFHVLAAAGIAHVAATRLRGSHGAQEGDNAHGGGTPPLPAQDGWLSRPDGLVLGTAICLGVLSHGVLDGLKHGYPFPAAPDVLMAGVLAASWCLCVHRRFLLLFASVILASLAPDIIDLGPAMLRSATGISLLTFNAGHLFPWHWPDGSGSMYPMSGTAPGPARILDAGQNTLVSWTNHLIVIAFAASGILMNPRVFRFHRRRKKTCQSSL